MTIENTIEQAENIVRTLEGTYVQSIKAHRAVESSSEARRLTKVLKQETKRLEPLPYDEEEKILYLLSLKK